MKLLVNAPTGKQEIVAVSSTGSYFDESLVIWDERTDGPLPDVTLGGMTRKVTIQDVTHPSVMGSDGKGEWIELETSWIEKDVPVPSLEFSQVLTDSRPVVVPVYNVAMAQAQKALVLSGVALSSVQAALEAITDPVERELALIDWNKSPTVSSDSGLVVSMAGALSLTADDVAQLFELAGSL